MMKNNFQTFGIVGAGAWGTAVAATLRRAGRDVVIWSHHPDGAADINMHHENRRHLSGVRLDPAIRATTQLGDLAQVDVLLLATPAQKVRDVARALAAQKPKAGIPAIIAAKGIETGSSMLMADVVAEELPSHPAAILSGPSFAVEVAVGKPAALTLATKDRALGHGLMHAIATPAFRPYYSDDMLGAQLGGAIKNVLAIASGIVTGKNFGENARAALITRGLAEIMRLGAAMGARAETLMGLSGLGDVLLTCSSLQSRNMSLGAALGQGQKLDDILGARTSVAEGVPTAAAAWQLAQKKGVDMPVVEAVSKILQGSVSVDQAVADLLARSLKAEVG